MKIINGSVCAPKGFLAQGVEAGIKKIDKKEVAIIYSTEPCTAAGVFTSNKVRAACIDYNKACLADGTARAIVANSGNANACTGEQGIKDSQRMADLTGELLGIKGSDVLVGSTGVIGVFMPMEKVEKGIRKAAAALSRDGDHNAAQAIMTTDLTSKELAIEIEIKGKPVRIGGIAKGSGMIHPNMATMLAFIATDAAIDSKCLREMVKAAADRSFNMISVDRDTSTNDMLVVLANALAGNPIIDEVDAEDYLLLQEALDYLCISLAKKIARDGEGATRLIEVQVVNAADYEEARQIARSITASNLTKAAVFGEDANWGRILAAAGYSGADFDPGRVDIYLGHEKMAENGMGLLFNEERARQELKQDPVLIRVDLKAGKQQATAWGCDLSYDYVRINAAYRT
ncbi:MAG: bifunctional glutamate N-acetyltransferase/amino-acid acetyltransferase ArgJ [Syntrophomonas sp.]|uniref:bifunctional glutamate N-acetyltransferase/amino-acid acetyltransferase ArgJ n=1 Tax=Syntrophomonas sp. TaxID=2053627 RepID=UPI0026091656|nr:bifunctional glutamate N-acetyltransferase/amino-acid acetyltransferase ArgJ [Syntrophomonas sp.]MDD3879251.1 bifunctional glutamate N-acetyltransferase/amino-acid acetyltransferase ArgJ [Syntrophomonas sp.]MDD4626980.1 bifunctional glutamate N-acetyltransferase/amino-acid acetyltransferase ArgJ [Syntrophomonas sp.]